MKHLLIILPFLACMVITNEVFAQDPVNDALVKAGLEPDKAVLLPTRWKDGGKGSLKIFNKVWDNWQLLDTTAMDCAKQLTPMAGSFTAMAKFAAVKIDVTPTDSADPYILKMAKCASNQKALICAIEKIHEHFKSPLSNQQKEELKLKIKMLPGDVSLAAFVILKDISAVSDARNKAFAKFTKDNSEAVVWDRAEKFSAMMYNADGKTFELINKLNLQSLIDGSIQLCRAMDSAKIVLDKNNLADKDFSFTWDTPAGRISINGKADNEYQTKEHLLIIDTAGEDAYISAGPSKHNISVIIDLAGNDKYTAENSRGFGAGIGGYGLLYDAAGDDTYKTKNGGLASAAFGVGILIDAAGNDSYFGRCHTQAAATYGVAILNDMGGDDRYECFQRSQGYGATRGCGILLDITGNDKYIANDTQIDFPSAQTKEHNCSLSQGVGFGRRANKETSLAGGVGMLIDAAGDDSYSTGVFGQGASYWFATGMLVDMAGDDTYKGFWYVQGSAVHYSASTLVDVAGNDSYKSHLQSTGHAKDLSAAILHDMDGNDSYITGGFVSGSAWMDAIALLRDDKGDDTYRANDKAFGFAEAAPRNGMCIGMFLDLAGKNTFKGKGKKLIEDKAFWVRKPGKNVYGLGELPQTSGK